MDDWLSSIVYGGVSVGVIGAALIWLAKDWISERLKQSIQHDYSEKLESYKTDYKTDYKTELNSKVEKIRHENQVSQLRTSLFFDHQRNAFASLITIIAQVNAKWMEKNEPGVGLFAPVPSSDYNEFKTLLYKHQLFLGVIVKCCVLELSGIVFFDYSVNKFNTPYDFCKALITI